MQFEDSVKQAITRLDISSHQPGALLHDFELFLQKVAEKPVPLSKTKQLPPPKWAKELDSQFSEPSVVTLKRTQAMHYPTVLGCYLLARASGLAQVITPLKGSAQLIINKEMVSQWQKLNNAERYFNLLDAWLNRGHAALVGDRIGGMDDRFFSCFLLHMRDKEQLQGKSFEKRALQDFPYIIGTYNLQLLKLFGLASLGFTDNSHALTFMQLTLWGQVILNACLKEYNEPLYDDEESPEKQTEFNLLSAVINCRDDVCSTIKRPEPDISASYIIKVSLGNDCWRTLAVPKDALLDDLVESILDAFNFDDKWHLYYFQYKDLYGRTYRCDHPELLSGNSYTAETCWQDLQPVTGMKIDFVFDMCANWEFIIQVESASNQTLKAIALTNQKGQAPEQYPDGKSGFYIITNNTVFEV